MSEELEDSIARASEGYGGAVVGIVAVGKQRRAFSVGFAPPLTHDTIDYVLRLLGETLKQWPITEGEP